MQTPATAGRARPACFQRLVLALTLASVACGDGTPEAGSASAAATSEGDERVVERLEPILNRHRIPALAGAILGSQGMQRLGVVGLRKAGTDVRATLQDRWHLGSDTKAMTATLVGRLVEQGLLRWDTRADEVFPDLAAAFHPDLRTVTLTQLLTHRAGVVANLDWDRIARGGTIAEQRLASVKQGLSAKPQHPPGSRYEYSNLGYVIVGAMVERKTGRTWEQAMQREVFAPLDMKETGFGGMGTAGQIDQPWGHQAAAKPVAANGPEVDNPPVLGPAGRVHATLSDWARFIRDQLKGARGESGLLKTATYRALRTPPTGADYARGWLVARRDWGGGEVLTHAGCNTMHYAVAWLAPARDFAVLVCTNQGDDVAARACDEAASALIALQGELARQPER